MLGEISPQWLKDWLPKMGLEEVCILVIEEKPICSKYLYHSKGNYLCMLSWEKDQGFKLLSRGVLTNTRQGAIKAIQSTYILAVSCALGHDIIDITLGKRKFLSLEYIFQLYFCGSFEGRSCWYAQGCLSTLWYSLSSKLHGLWHALHKEQKWLHSSFPLWDIPLSEFLLMKIPCLFFKFPTIQRNC